MKARGVPKQNAKRGLGRALAEKAGARGKATRRGWAPRSSSAARRNVPCRGASPLPAGRRPRRRGAPPVLLARKPFEGGGDAGGRNGGPRAGCARRGKRVREFRQGLGGGAVTAAEWACGLPSDASELAVTVQHTGGRVIGKPRSAVRPGTWSCCGVPRARRCSCKGSAQRRRPRCTVRRGREPPPSRAPEASRGTCRRGGLQRWQRGCPESRSPSKPSQNTRASGRKTRISLFRRGLSGFRPEACQCLRGDVDERTPCDATVAPRNPADGSCDKMNSHASPPEACQ